MTGVFLLLWSFLTIVLLYQIYKRIRYRTQEGFQDVYDPTDLASFFQPFQLEEVCKVYSFVYPKVVQGESLDGEKRRSDQEARDAANKLLKGFIPGELLECPIQFPTEKSLEVVDQALSKLPDTFLATVFATLVFCTSNLQESQAAMFKALKNAEEARREGFQDICTKEQAEEKKKQKAAAQCISPEDLTPEQKQKVEQELRQRIQAKMKTLVDTYLNWRSQKAAGIEAQLKDLRPQYEKANLAKVAIDKKVKEAGEDVPEEMRDKQQTIAEVFGTLEAKVNEQTRLLANLNQTIASLVKTCQTILPKLEKTKANLEAGNYNSSVLEGLQDYFQSPLR